MTRVHNSGAHGAHAPATLDRPRAASRKKKPYKIVLEAVTQEKRKLQSILTYHDQAPPGFGYIPVGYPEITEWCKEQCRQRNLDVHIVSAKPKNRIHHDPEKISHHVHRIGHHFPLDIIDLACSKFGYRFTDKNGLQKDESNRTTYGEDYFERGIADYRSRQTLHGRPMLAGHESKDLIRGAVREMFPKIPEADLDSIVNHAFEKGTNRVGNATELSLARRVQLAVVAHIRHTYTEYDTILKTKSGSWNDARRMVEHVSLAKLKEWRDEVGQASNELEETFREVIVLDDDEDGTSDDDTPKTDTRESSMEFFSSRATARDLQPEPIDRMPGNYSYAARAPRRTVILRPISYPGPSPYPGTSYSHLQTYRAEPRVSRPVVAASQPHLVQHELLQAAHTRPIESRQLVRAEPQRVQMRDSDGRLYNLQRIEEPPREERIRRTHGLARPAYDYAPTAAHRHAREEMPSRLTSHSSRPMLLPVSRRASDQDVVLPSVEREPGVPSETSMSRPRRGESVSYLDVHTPKRKSFPSSVYSPQEVTKRLRPVYDEPYTETRPRVPPPYQPTNPVSSPLRPTNGGPREAYGAPSNPGYVLAANSPRAYMYESDRPYGDRVNHPVQYSTNRLESARHPTEDGRYRLH